MVDGEEGCWGEGGGGLGWTSKVYVLHVGLLDYLKKRKKKKENFKMLKYCLLYTSDAADDPRVV